MATPLVARLGRRQAEMKVALATLDARLREMARDQDVPEWARAECKALAEMAFKALERKASL